MTQRELFNAIKGYNDRQTETIRSTWEQTRWLGAIIINVNSPKKKVQPRDLIKLPWDSEEVDRSEDLKELEKRRKWLTQ